MLVTARQVKTTYIINLTIMMDGNFTTTVVGGVVFVVDDG